MNLNPSTVPTPASITDRVAQQEYYPDHHGRGLCLPLEEYTEEEWAELTKEMNDDKNYS